MKEQRTFSAVSLQKESKQKNLFIFLVGAIFTYISFNSLVTVLPLYVYDLGGTEFDTGIQSTLFFLAAILMRFYFGPLTDRKGRKIPLMIGAFAFTISSLLFMLCDTVLSVTLVRIIHAVGLASFLSSGGSLIVDLAPPNQVGVYIGLYRLTFVLGLLSGPSLAMAVINSYSFKVWFMISFLIGLLSLLLVSLIKTPVHIESGESDPLKKFAVVLKEKAAYQVFYGITLAALAYGVLLTFTVLFISQNTSIANPGLYFTSFSIVGILGNLGSGFLSDRFGRSVVVWPSLMLAGVGVGILYFLPQIPGILLLSSIMAGLGYSGGIASLAAWLVEVTNKDNRGTVLAIQESIIDLGMGIASLAFGIVSGFVGMGGAFALIGMIVFFASIVKLLGRGRRSQSSQIN